MRKPYQERSCPFHQTRWKELQVMRPSTKSPSGGYHRQAAAHHQAAAHRCRPLSPL